MKNFDEKAAREMIAKAYQERQRKRLEVSLQTRGLLLCDEPGMKSKKNVNQPNDFKSFRRITLRFSHLPL